VEKSKYSIFSIVIHCGKNIQAGHYVSIIKRKEKWYMCDDDEVEEMNENDVEAKNAYLLFYRLDNN
jgi:ubiquitin carboxyl-terminal hydrolase 22/27/51